MTPPPPAVVLLLAAALPPADEIEYPPTPTVDHVDVYHGVEVADPYRWLEQDVRASEEVARWVEAQNAVTSAYLAGIEEREAIRRRLEELWNYPRYSTPFRAGPRYAFKKNDGLQDQSVLYVMDSLEGEPRVLLDPNTWSEDGTVALSGMAFSDDGRHLAFGRSRSGSDWRTWHVLDVETGEELPDRVEWIKWSGLAWTNDGKGFFYTRYPRPEEGAEYQASNLDSSIWYHRLGTSQDDDVLVHQDPDHPEHSFHATVTEDGRYLVVSAFVGTDARNRLLVRDLDEPYGTTVPVIDDFENEWSLIGNDGALFYFKTDLDAPRGRIVRMDVTRGLDSLEEIVPQAGEPLRGVDLVANLLVCRYLRDVLPLTRIVRLDGEPVREVTFPGIGSASGFDGRRTDTETFYTWSSYDTPPSIYHYDMLTGESTPWRRAEVDVDPDDYVVQQVFYTSADGTRVPMFVAHREGVVLDGDNPTLLYGYGGFNVTLTPGFSVTRVAWMDMGGVYAVANLRGGGEYGEPWHEAGTKLDKQNVFDDFIAAAEWLIDEGYTRPGKLAIHGGSNGGLLVGAVMTQRPELFGAAIPSVGVMDMLKFHRWTAGRFWVDDYGSAEDPEEFEALLAYSPYHNLREAVAYPATLVTTADTDDRVVPGHSFKFAARLQAAHAGEAPVLIRIETKAGHGAGTPTSKAIEKYADMWAFLHETLRMDATP